jgi:hypothetical protein
LIAQNDRYKVHLSVDGTVTYYLSAVGSGISGFFTTLSGLITGAAAAVAATIAVVASMRRKKKEERKNQRTDAGQRDESGYM